MADKTQPIQRSVEKTPMTTFSKVWQVAIGTLWVAFTQGTASCPHVDKS